MTALTASVAATGIVVHSSPDREKVPVLVHALRLQKVQLTGVSAKLSIYSIPTPEILLQDTPLPLERQIGAIRRKITGALRDTHSEVQGLVSRWIAVEHAIESALSV